MSAPMTPDREQEIRAELTAEFVAWLVKRAREHRVKGPQYAKQADVIGMLASKVQRGAVRPNNLLSLPPQGGPEDVPALRAEVDRLSDELTGANLALWEDGREIDRLRLALKAAQRGRRQLRARVAELEALEPARFQTCRACGAGYEHGQPCSTCEFKKRMAAEVASVEDPHDSPLHHTYALGRDLPEVTPDPSRDESVAKLRALLGRQTGGAL